MKTNYFLSAICIALLLSCGRNYPDLSVSPIADRTYERLFQLKVNGTPVANAKVVQHQKLDKDFVVLDSQDSVFITSLGNSFFDTLICNIKEYSDSNSTFENLLYNSTDTFFNVNPNIAVGHKINEFFKREITQSNIEFNLLAVSSITSNRHTGNFQGKLFSFGESDSILDDVKDVNGVVSMDGNAKFHVSGSLGFKKIVATISEPVQLNGSLVGVDGNNYSHITLLDTNSVTLSNDSLKISFKQIHQVNGDSLVKYVLNLKKL